MRLYRGEEPEFALGSNREFSSRFPEGAYRDITGVCRVATIAEIAAQGWSLNPGRYVGTEVEDLDDEVFEERLAAARRPRRARRRHARHPRPARQRRTGSTLRDHHPVLRLIADSQQRMLSPATRRAEAVVDATATATFPGRSPPTMKPA